MTVAADSWLTILRSRGVPSLSGTPTTFGSITLWSCARVANHGDRYAFRRACRRSCQISGVKTCPQEAGTETDSALNPGVVVEDQSLCCSGFRACPIPEELVCASRRDKLALRQRILQVSAVLKARVEKIAHACSLGQA